MVESLDSLQAIPDMVRKLEEEITGVEESSDWKACRIVALKKEVLEHVFVFYLLNSLI